MDFSLSPAQKMLSEAARNCAKPLSAGDLDARWKMLSEQGFTSMLRDESTHSFSMTDAALSLYHLAAAGVDGGTVFSLAAHLCAGLFPVLVHGSKEQRELVLGRVSAHRGITANAMTEASSGSDAFAMKTSAVKNENGYLLQGSKVFVTNAPVADFIVVYAVTDEAKGFFGGISAFLLEKGKHDFRVGPEIEKPGLKNSPLAEVFFDQTSVAETDRIGREGSGALIFQQSMNAERAVMSAMHAGVIQFLVDQTRSYVLSRHAGEQLLASHQAVAFRLADMQVRAETSLLLAMRAAALCETGKEATRAAAQAKIFSSEALVQSAQDAFVLHGGNGYTNAYRVAEILNDAQASLIYSGANDVLRQLVSGLS